MLTTLRSGRRLALAAVALVALAQGAASAGTTTKPIGLTKPVQATATDVNPGRTYSSPAFAIDPRNPLRVVAGFADLRTRRCGLMRSGDGGQHWTMLDSSPALASYPFCSQSQGGVIQAPLAFGRNGTLYMALGGWDDQDGTRTSGALLVARSTDLGDTWKTVKVRDARGKTGEDAENLRPFQSLAVDSTSANDDIVYVTFNLARPGFTAPNAVPTKPMVAVSRDGGRTFADAVDLSAKAFDGQGVRDSAFTAVTTTTVAPNATTTTTAAPAAGSKAAQPNQAANFGGSTARAVVDKKGTAYVLWQSATANVTPAPPSARFLSTSTDGGKTWTTTQAAPFSYDNGAPRLAIAPNGTLHMVYQRNPQPALNGLGDIYHQASTDGGKTWSEPKILSDDDPSKLFGQYIPNISVAPNGRVDAVWWDTRDDPGTRSNDVFYAYSTDNGKTWSKNQRITDQLVDRKLGVWGANFDISSPPAVASADAYALFGWDDTRNSDVSSSANAGFGGGLQDIYTALIQFKVVGAGGTSKAVKAVLAGVIGLLAVGLVLLAAGLGARRRGERPARRAGATTGKEPAGVS